MGTRIEKERFMSADWQKVRISPEAMSVLRAIAQKAGKSQCTVASEAVLRHASETKDNNLTKKQ